MTSRHMQEQNKDETTWVQWTDNKHYDQYWTSTLEIWIYRIPKSSTVEKLLNNSEKNISQYLHKLYTKIQITSMRHKLHMPNASFQIQKDIA